MISGKFVDNKVILPVRFILPEAMSFSIEFILVEFTENGSVELEKL
jgi:hypothetical protein